MIELNVVLSPPHTTLRRRRAAASSALGILLITTFALAGCDRGGEAAGGGAGAAQTEMPAARVTVTPAEARDVPVYLDEIGRTVAVDTVVVQPQVGGRVDDVHFEDGQEIAAGADLFTIDPRPFEAAVAAAEADVAQRQAELKRAQQDFARVKDLFESAGERGISRQEYDLRQTAVSVARAQVKSAQAALKQAKLDLSYCHITSPIDGRAGERMVDEGNVVEAMQDEMLTIHSLDPIYAEFTTAERNLPDVRRHMNEGTLRVQVRVPGEQEEPREGELTFLDTAVQTGTGTVKLRATVPNEDRRFWAGQFVEVRLILETKPGAVLVPTRAVQIGQTGPFVYVVTDQSTAELRPVTRGQRQDGGLIVIEEGVAAGERVVTTGHMAVMPGNKVQVTEDAAPGGAPGGAPPAGAGAAEAKAGKAAPDAKQKAAPEAAAADAPAENAAGQQQQDQDSAEVVSSQNKQAVEGEGTAGQ